MSINLTQQFIFETDDKNNFYNMLKTILPILFDSGKVTEYGNLYLSKHVDSLFLDDYEKCHKILYLSDYRTDMKKHIREKEHCINLEYDYDLAVRAVENILDKVDDKEIMNKLESQIESYFDGTVEIGYHMHMTHSTWSKLVISKCLIYYGK